MNWLIYFFSFISVFSERYWISDPSYNSKIRLEISGLIKNVEENPSDNHIFIDLIKCSIQCCDKEIFFDIHEKDRSLLIEGLDEIEKVLIYKNNIDSFEADHKKIRPWL